MAEVEKYYPKQQSLDLSLTLGAATDGGPIGGPIGGLGASGPDGTSGILKFSYNKAFQLSFPYLGERD